MLRSHQVLAMKIPRPPPGVLVTQSRPRAPDSGYIFTIDLRTKNSLNGSREHWAVKAKRVKSERAIVALTFPRALKGVMARGKWPKCIVHLIRYGPRVMDGDGLSASLKGVRDELAAQLGIDDGDARIAWTYEQAKGEYAVSVQVERVENEPPENRRPEEDS